MNGYIINRSPLWTRAMKREVRPNGKIKINDLYAQYGKKHNLKEGEEFINWLKLVKLKGGEWDVITEDEEILNTTEDNYTNDNVVPIVPNSKLSVEEISLLTVRAAREIVPEITDLQVLKMALRDTSKMANKDNLCRMLRKRVQELEQYS
jgi:hypothetical protein